MPQDAVRRDVRRDLRPELLTLGKPCSRQSARWKLLPLAFPLAKAAGFVSDPSLHGQTNF